MENDNYFIKNQKRIRKILSTEFGEVVSCGLKVGKNTLAKVTPNSVHVVEKIENGKAHIKARYFGVDNFAKEFIPALTKLEIAEQEYKPIDDFIEAILHFAGVVLRPELYPSVYLAIDTFYSSSGDGHVKRDVSTGTSWVSLRNATAGTAVDYTGNTNTIVADNNCGGNALKRIWRLFYAMDVSGLDPLATIVSAKLSIKASNSTGSAQSMTLQEGTQASTTSLSTADYDNVNSPELATRLSSLPGAGSRAEWTLNSTGLALLSGTVKYCVRYSRDLDNSEPSSGLCAYQSYYTSEQTGTGDDPYLEITYTLPVVSQNPLIFGGGRGFTLG